MQGDDPSTWQTSGLPGREGWVAVLQVEEQRARRHGGVHGLVLVRVDGPADLRLAEDAAEAIASAIRDIDFLAQIDHQTFAVLALHCNDLATLVSRLREALDDIGAGPAAVVDARPAGADLRATWAAMTPALPVARPGHVEFVAPVRPSLN